MPSPEVLKKEKRLVNGRFIVTQTLQQEITRSELERELFGIETSKKQLIQQSVKIQEQYNALCQKEVEVREMISELPQEELPIFLKNEG